MRHPLVPTSAALLALSCFLHTTPAKADTYLFTISTPTLQLYPLTGTGILTTSDAGNGAQYITGIAGTVDNSANTLDPGSFAVSLIPTTAPGQVSTVSYNAQNGSQFFFNYDNLLFPGAATPLNGNGLAFTADGVSYDIGFVGAQAEYLGFRANDINFDQHTFQGVPISFTVTPQATAVTPEPAPVALLGTGLLGLAGIVRRRMS